jgi:hypothetical protein
MADLGRLVELDDDDLLAALGAALAVEGERVADVVPLAGRGMRRRPSRTWLAVAAAAALVVAGAVALSGDDGSSDVATAPSTTVTATTAPPSPVEVASDRLDDLERALSGPDDAAVLLALDAARQAVGDLTVREAEALRARADLLFAAAEGRFAAPPATTPTTTGGSPATTPTTAAPPPPTTPSSTPTTDDVSGHCDEPEHVDDPECTGGVVPDDDNSGPGGGGSSGSGSDD